MATQGHRDGLGLFFQTQDSQLWAPDPRRPDIPSSFTKLSPAGGNVIVNMVPVHPEILADHTDP